MHGPGPSAELHFKSTSVLPIRCVYAQLVFGHIPKLES